VLQITIPAAEAWDESRQEFVGVKEQTLQLEHSLVSLSKWESRWHKAFLSKNDKTEEELRDYIRCMTLTQNVNPNVYQFLTNENLSQIKEYIDDPMSATVINSTPSGNKSSREVVTSELIYYWMITLNIPPEYQKWHLNRLLKLIEVCNIKNTPPKKRSKSEIMRSNAALNAARRRQYGSRG
jgi:hypothetical protein